MHDLSQWTGHLLAAPPVPILLLCAEILFQVLDANVFYRTSRHLLSNTNRDSANDGSLNVF
jgi:hypothetical protein